MVRINRYHIVMQNIPKLQCYNFFPHPCWTPELNLIFLDLFCTNFENFKILLLCFNKNIYASLCAVNFSPWLSKMASRIHIFLHFNTELQSLVSWRGPCIRLRYFYVANQTASIPLRIKKCQASKFGTELLSASVSQSHAACLSNSTVNWLYSWVLQEKHQITLRQGLQ